MFLASFAPHLLSTFSRSYTPTPLETHVGVNSNTSDPHGSTFSSVPERIQLDKHLSFTSLARTTYRCMYKKAVFLFFFSLKILPAVSIPSLSIGSDIPATTRHDSIHTFSLPCPIIERILESGLFQRNEAIVPSPLKRAKFCVSYLYFIYRFSGAFLPPFRSLSFHSIYIPPALLSILNLPKNFGRWPHSQVGYVYFSQCTNH